MPEPIATRRARACRNLLAQVHSLAAKEGVTPSFLHAVKLRLVALADKSELFPLSDFAMPEAEARNHKLLVEENDGLGLYLSIGTPGKLSSPHAHGIWCINAAVSGRELHTMYRRVDDGASPGRAEIAKVGEVMLEPGNGFAMGDYDIHGTAVVGEAPAVTLILYGYALNRFPSVTWYNPEFGSVRSTASQRHAV